MNKRLEIWWNPHAESWDSKMVREGRIDRFRLLSYDRAMAIVQWTSLSHDYDLIVGSWSSHSKIRFPMVRFTIIPRNETLRIPIGEFIDKLESRDSETILAADSMSRQQWNQIQKHYESEIRSLSFWDIESLGSIYRSIWHDLGCLNITGDLNFPRNHILRESYESALELVAEEHDMIVYPDWGEWWIADSSRDIAD